MGGVKPLKIFKGAPHNPGIKYKVNDNTNKATNNLPTEIWITGLSCGKAIFPNKYNAQAPNTAIQITRNISLSKICNCNTKSTLDKNLKAKANSKNPSDTLTVFNQLPDFGNEFNQPGNMANSIKGKAIADEKPSIPIIGPMPPNCAASAIKVPTIGPVQEKDTIASANAINKIPTKPPRSACLSTLLAQEFGSTISKAPKNEEAKINNRTKNIRLNHTLVDKAFKASIPKITETNSPKTT